VWEMRCTLTLSLLLVVMHHLGHCIVLHIDTNSLFVSIH
jgi:hypothetical protein